MVSLDRNGFEETPLTLVEGYPDDSILRLFEIPVTGLYRYQVTNGTAIKGLDFTLIDGQGNSITSDWGFLYGVGNPVGSQFNQRIIPAIQVIDDNTNEPDKTFNLLFTDVTSGVVLRAAYKITDTLRTPKTNSLEPWANVENLTLTGSNNINGVGNSGNNVLIGNTGNNILDGKEGNDILIGGGGIDTLIGDAGNDTYQIDPLNSGGSRIRDVSGTNDVVNISGIVEKRLTSGQIGFGRDGTTLIIDLDKNGKVNLIKDLAVENFFSTSSGWKSGTGFIEQIGGFSSNRVLNLFGLEGEETLTIGADDRKIKLQFVQPNATSLPVESALRQNWDGSNVWIVSHGWLPPLITNRQKINDLANVVAQSRPGDIVLTLDWSNAAGTVDVLNAAKWINPIAEVVADKLRVWGLTNGTKINLIGHSLGSLLSTEIAARVGFAQTITALEPPSESFGLYDLDGRTTSFRERPKSFSGFSNFSRAFVGSTSFAASSEFAATADESILMQFDGIRLDEHGDVITAFTNMIRRGTPKLTSNLFSLTDNTKHSQLFKDDAFYRTLSPNIQEVSFRVYEGVIKVNGMNQLISLTGKPPQTPNPLEDPSDVIYGTNGNDILDGRAGADKLTGGTGNDTYIIDNIGDIIDETSTLATEIDTVQSSITYTLGTNLEDLTLLGTSTINGTGNSLNNSLTGNTVNNILNGGARADILTGLAGADTLTGGLGADRFLFNSNRAFVLADLGVDRITDFLSGTDKIVLDKTAFTALTSVAGGAIGASEFAIINGATNGATLAGSSTARIVFNRANGDLFYNPDGITAGLGLGGRFAILSGVSSLTATDLLLQA